MILIDILSFPASDGLSSEQKQLQSEALKFARQEMAPHMSGWDEKVNHPASMKVLITMPMSEA